MTKKKKKTPPTIILRLPATLKKEIKTYAKTHDLSMMHMLRLAANAYMKANP